MERRVPEVEFVPASDQPVPAADPATGLPNAFLFWPIALVVVFIDVVTKAIAATALVPALIPHPVIGEFARLTLVYNRGAAFGIHVGPYSRPIFALLTLGALAILWRLYRTTEPTDRRRVIALALVSAGAVGNLFDRVRSARGVVDFIDIGSGSWRWPTFNVADVAVTTGAVLLAVVLWQEDRAAARAAGDRSSTAVRSDATASDAGRVDGSVAGIAERGGIA